MTDEVYLHLLITILDEVAAKWKEIGLALGFTPGALDCIEQSPTLIVKGPRAYLQELIRQWLEREPSPTIEALQDALKDVDELVLAEGLVRKGKTDQYTFKNYIHFLLILQQQLKKGLMKILRENMRYVELSIHPLILFIDRVKSTLLLRNWKQVQNSGRKMT